MSSILLILPLILSQASEASVPAAWSRTIEGLQAPNGVAALGGGLTLVTEPFSHRLTVLNANGSIAARWGGPGTGPGEFHRPSGVDATAAGVIAVADTGNHRVQFLNGRGEVLHVIDGRSRTDMPFRSPADVAITDHRLAVADTGNDRVRVFDSNGTHRLDLRGDAELAFRGPEGVALDEAGNIHVADTGNHRIVSFDADGTPIATWGSWGRFPGLFAEPCGIEARHGLLYVTDRLNHRVQVFTPQGELVTWWGMHAILLRQGEGHIHYPEDIAVSFDGLEAVVAEPFERRVQSFKPGPPARPDRSATRAPRGLQSHFGPQIATGGRGLLVWEPEVRQLAAIVTDREIPIHVTTFGVPGTTTGAIGDMAGCSFDPDAAVLTLIDSGQGTLQRWRVRLPQPDRIRFDPDAAALMSTQPLPDIESQRALRPGPMAVTDDGRVFVIDDTMDRVVTLDSQGRFTDILPLDETVDPVAIGINGSVVAIADGRSGQVHLHAVADGRDLGTVGPAPGLEHPWPAGVTILDDGSIVVSDRAADRLDRFSADGTHLNTMGGHGSDYGQLWMPGEVAQDALGRVVVVDHGNHRLQAFAPDGNWVLTFGLGRAMTPQRLKGRPQP